jgi:sulfonate transport system permease protein
MAPGPHPSGPAPICPEPKQCSIRVRIRKHTPENSMAAQGAILSSPKSTAAKANETSVPDAEPEGVKVETLELEPAAPVGSGSLEEAPEKSVLARMLEQWNLAGALSRWSVRILALAIGVLCWHWATTANLNYYINFENVPEPLKVWNAFVTQLSGSEFYIHILVSMQRIMIGYAFAVLIGVGMGLFMGRSKLVHDVLMPYVEILRPIPAVAWIPLAILMWPTEEASIIYITFLGALFPIILNTMHGVEQTPEVLVRAARSLGARQTQIFRHVVLPAALPSIATGLAVGMGVSWFSLLAGEIISGQYGIGYFTWNAYSLINYPDIVVGMLCIGFLGTASTYAVRLMTRPFLKWQERSK